MNDIIFKATTRGGRNFIEVTDTGTDTDRYMIKQDGAVDYANTTREVLAYLVKQSGWKEGTFDKIEIDTDHIGEQYLTILKMINKEFGFLYKSPKGSPERQYYFDIIRFIAQNIKNGTDMAIEDMIWKAKDALKRKGIMSSRRISSSTDDFIKRAVNFGQRNGLNIPELALAFSDGRRCSHEDYLKLCKWFKNQENVDRYYSGVELTSSRRISSSKSNILADLNDMESEFEVVNYMKKVFDKYGKPELYEKFCDEVDDSDDVPGVVAEKYINEIFNSRRISSSQKGMENVAEGTKYDDYHIDTNGMGILSVENIIEEIEGRGNQAVLTVQTSDGSTNHSQFGSKDWKEYKDSVNNAGNSITDVWVTEVKGSSYVRNSRRPIKSGIYDECIGESADGTYSIYKNDSDKVFMFSENGRVTKEVDYNDDEVDGVLENWIEIYDVKIKPQYKNFVYNSRKITSARYIATDPESGEVLGSADTYEEAINEWGEDVTITDSEAAEGQEDMELFQSRKITSAVDGGWEVRSSDVPEALDLFVEYFGEEDALEEIAKAMGDNVLQENIEWIAQQWGFGEEIEDLDVWEQYETAKEYMGVSELFNNLTQAAGYDELAEDLAFIFRMNDFREWDKYDNEEDEEDDDWEDDEEIESSLQNSFPVKTVKNIMSGAWTEKQAAQNIAEKQNINVGYAKQILSSWIEQYKPKLIKSGILDIAEDINTEFDIDGDLESWAEQYTNPEGKSNTVGGEMVRAAMQIIYRYNNDGDMIGRGYGNETVNAAARYITEKAEMGVNEQIQKWLDHEERADDYEYDNFIETFTTEIEQILRENPELFQKPNKDDYWNWKEDEDMNYGLDECYLDDGSGNQYWFRLDNDRWTCTGIELDPYSITYQEGDTINEGDEYSDEILSPGEEFGSFEADGFIYEYAGDNWDDDREEYTSWQITKVTPQDPYCDEGDTFDFYDLEPDELSGFRLFDHNGNEIDERTFLASSLKTK